MTRISDIARSMNLSEATVSNALTGKGRMKPETREAIRACAVSMGYQRRLRRSPQNKGGLIAIAENLDTSFVSPMLSGAISEACRNGLSLPIFSLQITDATQLRNPDIRELNLSVQEFLASLDHQVSGILYLSQYARRIDGLLSGLSIPVVSAFATREDGEAFVHYDDHQGAYLAVNALLDSGCRKIAMISGPINSIGMYLRSSGYQQALVERGLLYDPRLVRIGDWDLESGYALTSGLLQEETGIDGIFAQNDMIGLGAFQAVRERGLSVPEDVSIIGFDDRLPDLPFVPRLSTIRPPFEQMGQTALSLLLDLVREENVPAPPAQNRAPLLPCTLIRRESTRPVTV